ncbi:MAG: hypothetical protein AB7T31_18105 [Gemmatimonadales bacterium]
MSAPGAGRAHGAPRAQAARRAAHGLLVLAAGALVCACADEEALTEPPPTLDGLVLDTLFEVGDQVGAIGPTFGGIWDVEAAPDGRFAVLDLEAPAVHVFDAAGALLGSITATGLDEGALDRPSGLSWARNGELLVWDPGSSWISRFRVGSDGVTFADRSRAFAFGETGFCASGDHTYLSYWQDDDNIVHEIGAEGPVRSFGPAPHVVGVDSLGPELQEIAIEELTPSALLCTPIGVLDVSFMQSGIRLHDWEGAQRWGRELDDFTPVVAYTPDGMGLGRMFDAVQGSHLLRSVVPWGQSLALVQHELRTQEIPDEGEIEVFESRLIRLDDGAEVGRSRSLPLVLSAQGNHLYLVQRDPSPQVIVVEATSGM